MTMAPVLPAGQRAEQAADAGQRAAAVLAAAEHAIVTAMASAASKTAAGTLTPLLAAKQVRVATAAALGTASARLHVIHGRAAAEVTGREDAVLPAAPGQVAAAVLHAQQDAGTAFRAVLAAITGGGNGTQMPPPSSPYRRITVRAVSQAGGPGQHAAQLVLNQVSARGLTGYVTPAGRRQPLAAYAQRVTRAAVARLARMPATGEIEARREQLLAVHSAAVTAAWRHAAAGLDTAGMLARYRSDIRVTSTAADEKTARRWRQEAARAAADAWIAPLANGPGYDALAAVFEALAADGLAEGEADALAVAAARQRAAGFSIPAAYESARGRVDEGTVRQRARDAATGLLSGVARSVAHLVARTGGDPEQGEIEDTAGKAAERAADYSLWAAFGAGALGLWQRAASALGGMFGAGTLVDWLDSASACPLCTQNAAGSPYAPRDVPPYPAHGRCRCVLDSSARVPFSWLASFLG